MDKIIAKYLIRAELQTTSPFLIANGLNDEADVEVIKLPNGKPYIPGSSFTGSLRSRFKKLNVQTDLFNYLWGTNKANNTNSTFQSHLIIDDLLPNNNTEVTIRDGVKIDSVTEITQKGSKYDYQLVEPGVNFSFHGEAILRDIKGISQNDFEEALGQLIKIIESNTLRVGAQTNFGLGKVSCTIIHLYKFQFPEDSDSWFSYIREGTLPAELDWKELVKKINSISPNTFNIKAEFQLKTSLITSTYGVNPDKPDKTQLKSKNKFVLSGKSIKGAIRHRALKILATKLALTIAEKKLREMMGWVNPNNSEEEAIKSRLLIEETIINEGAISQEQPRIKINRFEGGATKTALFTSEGIWREDSHTFVVEMNLEKKYDWEAGLLLHILKDLWTEDLAIGGEKNIGRGILVGKKTTITWDENSVEITTDDKGEIKLDQEKIGLLNKFSEELNKIENNE